MPAGKPRSRKKEPAPVEAARAPAKGVARSNNRYISIQLGVARALAEELAELRPAFPPGDWTAPDGQLALTQDGKEYDFIFDNDSTSKAILLLINNLSLITDVLLRKTDEAGN